MIPDYNPALASHATVPLTDGPVDITTSSFADNKHPVGLHAGPASIAMSIEQAIAVGSALIAAAHHYRAVLAEREDPTPPVVP